LRHSHFMGEGAGRGQTALADFTAVALSRVTGEGL
jgi:hypothetical protein